MSAGDANNPHPGAEGAEALPAGDTHPEAAALEALATRLQGFGSAIQAEWLDGAITAVAAGPFVLPLADWAVPLLGEEFPRAYADPDDVQRALHAVNTRFETLRRMLDGEALLDEPDALRLEPLIYRWGDDPPPPEAGDDALALFQGGALWAEGFLSAVGMLPELWPEPEDGAAAELMAELLADIEALLRPTPADAELPPAPEGEEPMTPREAAIDRAMFAAQDLRLFWIEHAPKPVTRRVMPQPGRNDPCPCGSGRKYKKCHGAAA